MAMLIAHVHFQDP